MLFRSPSHTAAIIRVAIYSNPLLRQSLSRGVTSRSVWRYVMCDTWCDVTLCVTSRFVGHVLCDVTFCVTIGVTRFVLRHVLCDTWRDVTFCATRFVWRHINLWRHVLFDVTHCTRTLLHHVTLYFLLPLLQYSGDGIIKIDGDNRLLDTRTFACLRFICRKLLEPVIYKIWWLGRQTCEIAIVMLAVYCLHCTVRGIQCIQCSVHLAVHRVPTTLYLYGVPCTL